jgi:hypothetical protein
MMHLHDGQTGRRFAASLSALVVMAELFCAPASAAEGDDLIERGIVLRKQDRDQEALILFQKALDKQATPRAFAQLGLCEQALGLWVAAQKHLDQALAHPEDAWVKKNETALRGSLAHVQQNIGAIEVWGTPEGARVIIDGAVVGTLPMREPVRVPIGKRTVTVEAAGFVSETQTHEIAGEAFVRAHVALVPVAIVTSLQNTGSLAAPTLVRKEDEPSTVGGPIYKRWWFWAGAGALVLAGVASAVLLTRGGGDCRSPGGDPCNPW